MNNECKECKKNKELNKFGWCTECFENKQELDYIYENNNKKYLFENTENLTKKEAKTEVTLHDVKKNVEKQDNEIKLLNKTFKNYLNFSSLFLVLISISLTTIISIVINVNEKIATRPHTEIIFIIGFIFLCLCLSFIICFGFLYLLSWFNNKYKN